MKTIRSLERGLQVLALLTENRGHPLHELHQRSGLAKATLLRILLTLEGQGLVWRAIGDGCYRRSTGPRPRSAADEAALRIAEAASPHLEALQRKVIWPSDLLIPRHHRLELVESSRRQSNIGLQLYRLGYQVDMFLSAPGRAYLAFCSDAERRRVLDHARRRPPANPRARAVLNEGLEALLAETRRLGYGSRDALFGGSDRDIAEFDDKLDAIAVPVLDEGRVLACMNLVWPRKYRLKAKIVRDHLADLRAAAAAVAESLRRLPKVSPGETVGR